MRLSEVSSQVNASTLSAILTLEMSRINKRKRTSRPMMQFSKETSSMKFTVINQRAAGLSRKTTQEEWHSLEIIFGRDTQHSIELTPRSMDQFMWVMDAKMKTSAL